MVSCDVAVALVRVANLLDFIVARLRHAELAQLRTWNEMKKGEVRRSAYIPLKAGVDEPVSIKPVPRAYTF